MKDTKREKKNYGMKDRQVPPVKGAVTDFQDLVQKPAAIFGTAHPAEPVNLGNAEIFDLFQ